MTYPWEASYPPGRDWHAPIEPFAIDDVLDRSAARWQERTLVDFYDRRISYGAMLDLSRQVARGLQDLGVGVGAHIGLHLANGPHYIACFFAVLKPGGPAAHLYPPYP